MNRFRVAQQLLCFSLIASAFTVSGIAQTQLATVNGRILDPNSASIVGATVTARNLDNGIETKTQTNDQGVYFLFGLEPGRYQFTVSKTGFSEILKPDVILHVSDSIAMNFSMRVGSVSEEVTVEGGAPLVDTENAAVSTVIDRKFVDELPLNGRSFNTLLQLTPGVTISAAGVFSPGQFSVNGQRTNANSFTVDGVSANFGISPNTVPGQAGAGGAQAFNVFGGTSSLVSVDAMQEFRVETSSFAPEYGRTPGAQVIIGTRAGTAQFHGGAFDYFRNDSLDANDWFANANHLARAPEHQNDFGGFIGGPVLRDRLFFFASYEGLRLDQPKSLLAAVPSVQVRANAPSGIADLLDAFPLPAAGAPLNSDGETTNLGSSVSDRTTTNSGSLRIDEVLSPRLSLFGRLSYAPSTLLSHGNPASDITQIDLNTTTVTAGAEIQISRSISDSLRFNFSRQSARNASFCTPIQQAKCPAISLIFPSPLAPDSSLALFLLSPSLNALQLGTSANNDEEQVNITNGTAITGGVHQVKFGADFRNLYFNQQRRPAGTQYYNFNSIQSLSSGGSFPLVLSGQDGVSHILFPAISGYAQDTWKATQNLTLTYGIRWESNIAPSGRDGTTLMTFYNIETPSLLSPAPRGTPLWKTTYGSFAPRVGLAYHVGWKGDLVLRGGGGLFYDLAGGTATNAVQSVPNLSGQIFFSMPFPVANPSSLIVPLPTPGVPPFSPAYLFARDAQLPQSWQWNAAVEKSLGTHQVISATYLGQLGRKLLNLEQSYILALPIEGGPFDVTENLGRSSYHALQVQYRRPLYKRLQGVLSYNWSHSIDDVSSDAFAGLPPSAAQIARNRGSSAFDIRQSVSGAFTVNLPSIGANALLARISENWTLDGVVQARTGFPVDVTYLNSSFLPPFPVSLRPDRIADVPFYISDSSSPAGKRINVNAFDQTTPATQKRQGTLGRDAIPGFGATQLDLSIGRRFPLTEKVNLQFRTDAFNLLNHPNFANPQSQLGTGTFGLSTQSLAAGLGGLSPLYQLGGPRSLQLSLRLAF